MEWFKFYGQEFLTDPKMLSLNAVERSLWVTILCLANNTEDGVIRYIDEGKIMFLTGVDAVTDEWEKNKGFLEKFEKLGMVKRDDNGVSVINFVTKQNKSLSSYERVKRYRARHKAKETHDNVTRNANDNAREDKRREDKNIKEKIIKRNSSLEDITESLIGKIAEDYHLPLAFVASKADDLRNYCAAKGKTYRDYPAALRSFVKKDAQKIVQESRLPSKSFDASTGGTHELTS